MMSTEVRKYDLKALLRFIEAKHVAVPEFQRGYVWKTRQVKNLFDSLIKRYPIGSFILWKTNQNLDARTLDGEELPREKYLILDGQQRMVSLYYLCYPKKFVQPHIKDKFHEICDNREKQLIDFEKFVIDKSDKGPVLGYARDNSCRFDFRRFKGKLKGYKFPVVVISLKTYRQAIEVFERINQAGTRISTESIFLSETWNTHSAIGKILRTWRKENPLALTSKIDSVIFIHVFALIYQLEKFTSSGQFEIGIKTLKKIADEIRADEKGRYNLWFAKVMTAVANAVDYLKTEFGIKKISELPSQTMLTVLSIFFYYQNRTLSAKQSQELKRWFWRSSLASRYIGSGYNQNVGRDAVRMRKLALKNQSLSLPRITNLGFSTLMKGVDIRSGRSTIRNVIKQALWKQGPVFIKEPVKREDVESGQHKPEYDHFFPYDWHRKGIIGNEINNIMNLHFLSGKENVLKSNKLPSEWLEERIKETGAKPADLRKYFDSELLPFRDLKDLKKFEKGLRHQRVRDRARDFSKAYNIFLRKRHELFESKLKRLQV